MVVLTIYNVSELVVSSEILIGVSASEEEPSVSLLLDFRYSD